MVPLYSIAWPSAENFAAVAFAPILVTQSPLSSFTFDVLISSSEEKRSLVVPPPLLTQLSPACSKSSSEVNCGAAAMPPSSVVSSGSDGSDSAGSASVAVVADVVPPLPPQAASTSAATSASNSVRTQSRRWPFGLPIPLNIYFHPFPDIRGRKMMPPSSSLTRLQDVGRYHFPPQSHR